jgi:glycerol-3-phosphate acyltransferase PlsY
MIGATSTSFALAAAIAGGYLLGSIPFGLLFTRWFGLGDIRKIGSGNIGATNVLRTGRRDVALLTLLADAGKAGAAVLLARYAFGANIGYVAGAAALVGHCWPVWLKFNGGKGVATFFGALLVGLFPAGASAGLIWLIVAFVFRFSSLAALMAAAAAPLLAYVFHGGVWAVAASAVMAAVIFWRHRANIARLVRGEEPRLGARASSG